MLTNRDNFLRGVPSVFFRFRSSLLSRIGLVLGSIAALLSAFQPNLHAQSSPLTVQPSTGKVKIRAV